jgi:hypothetical protein
MTALNVAVWDGTTLEVSTSPVSLTGIMIWGGQIINQTVEGFQIRFETTTANGTAYYVVYPPSAGDPIDPADIRDGLDGDGNPGLATGSTPITTTGEQTFSAITTLNPNINCKVAIVQYGTPGS